MWTVPSARSRISVRIAQPTRYRAAKPADGGDRQRTERMRPGGIGGQSPQTEKGQPGDDGADAENADEPRIGRFVPAAPP